MASFTFATGNAAGLRRLPFYLLGGLATLIVPRNRLLWAFGCGIGPGEGALPLYRLARAQLNPRYRLVWLATTKEELDVARSLGMDAELKLSRKGFWITLRAGVLVVTHGQGDVNRYAARGGFLVQLWHGIPLKRLHLDSPAALASNSALGKLVVERGYRVVGRQIRLFSVASRQMVPRFCTAFGLRDDQVFVSGDPRDDVLLHGSAAQRSADARVLLETVLGTIDAAGPVVMYAPTWREGAADPAEPDEAAWHDIVTWLDRVDGLLILRTHPLGHGDYAAGEALSPRVQSLNSNLMAEVTSVLPAIDHLVTDYSSMAFDFSLTDGTIVFLAPDIEQYLESRGLYEPYESFSGGRAVSTWQAALTELDGLVRPGSEILAAARRHTERLRDEHFELLDGRASERVLAEILRRTAKTS
jgi:CDP-glycerol glycerophosphotransferase